MFGKAIETSPDPSLQKEAAGETPDIASSENSSKGDLAQVKNELVQEWLTGWPLFSTLAGVTLVSFLMLLDTSIISTVRFLGILISVVSNLKQAIPVITRDFNSLVDVGWYGSAYQLAR